MIFCWCFERFRTPITQAQVVEVPMGYTAVSSNLEAGDIGMGALTPVTLEDPAARCLFRILVREMGKHNSKSVEPTRRSEMAFQESSLDPGRKQDTILTQREG